MPTLLPMFLTNFIKKISQVKLIIEELNTDEIIVKLNNGHLDAAIAATPLLEDKIKSFCTTNLLWHTFQKVIIIFKRRNRNRRSQHR
jgi:DNA-binding transcriptional LysR family regulator